MKADIHPKVHPVKVHCSCGNEFETYSTVKELRLDICGACHPHFTGKKRALDATGRAQKFAQKYAGVTPAAPKKKPAPPAKAQAVKAPKGAKKKA